MGQPAPVNVIVSLLYSCLRAPFWHSRREAGETATNHKCCVTFTVQPQSSLAVGASCTHPSHEQTTSLINPQLLPRNGNVATITALVRKNWFRSHPATRVGGEYSVCNAGTFSHVFLAGPGQAGIVRTS